jgi:hypothetical protein
MSPQFRPPLTLQLESSRGIPWLTISGIVVAAVVGLSAAYIGGRMQRQATERALDRELRTHAIADFTETLTTIISDWMSAFSLDPNSSEAVNARDKVRAGCFRLTAIGLRIHLLGLYELDREVELAKESAELARSTLEQIQGIFYAEFKADSQARKFTIPWLTRRKDSQDEDSQDFANARELAEAITRAIGSSLGGFNGKAQIVMDDHGKRKRLLAWMNRSGNHHEDDQSHTDDKTTGSVSSAEKSDG